MKKRIPKGYKVIRKFKLKGNTYIIARSKIYLNCFIFDSISPDPIWVINLP